MMYAVMYREKPSSRWEFLYWVPGGGRGGERRIIESMQGLLSSERAIGNAKAMAGYIECDNDTMSDQLHNMGRPRIVRYDPDHVSKESVKPKGKTLMEIFEEEDAVVVDDEKLFE